MDEGRLFPSQPDPPGGPSNPQPDESLSSPTDPEGGGGPETPAEHTAVGSEPNAPAAEASVDAGPGAARPKAQPLQPQPPETQPLQTQPPEAQPPEAQPPAEPRWQALGPIERRVIGVLAEKAKTTPDAYPMTLNAIRTGCNQKSNRAPVMSLEADEVEQSLERLRELGAAGVIHGHGRVPKYRHYLYEWLGVDKVELAVMAELLLRGAQTEGELRARAARMEPIRDLSELRPVLQRLKAKGLVVPLTPEGRGHVVTHALYLPQELDALKAQFGTGAAASTRATAPHAAAAGPAGAPSAAAAPESATIASPAAAGPGTGAYRAPEAELIPKIRQEIDELRGQLKQLQSDVEELADRQQQAENELQRFRDALGG